MSEYMRDKLTNLWFKLLKASVKHKGKKAAKIEQKIIELELELKNANK